MTKFVPSFSRRKGYTPKQSLDFSSLMEKQAKPVYERMGIIFPVITSSTVNFIAEFKTVSLLEIARGLDIPHQLVSQRIKILLKLDIVSAHKDPQDKRKTNYKLTQLGVAQNELFAAYLSSADKVFNELDAELGVDLMALLSLVNKSFANKSLEQRIFSKGD